MRVSEVPQGDVIEVDVDPAVMVAAYAGHRRRFAAEVSSLDRAALGSASRCNRWTVADVLRHLCDVDEWMTAIWSGHALPFAVFDPRVTPDEFVAARREVSDEEIRDHYVVSAETLATEVESSERERWGATSLSPLGFVPWWQSALHVLWDSWMHERDALLPVDVPVPLEADELEASLVYSLAVVGTLVREPVDLEVAGARLVTGRGRPCVTVSSDGVRRDDATAAVVDAIAGRGRLDDTLQGAGDDVLRHVDALARYLHA
jgi:uncharacterized protein (TIGR03083 family)